MKSHVKAIRINMDAQGSHSMSSTPILLTVKQVAQILQWNPFTIVKKAEKGELPGFKLGREWRFRQEDIIQWIEQKRNPT